MITVTLLTSLNTRHVVFSILSPLNYIKKLHQMLKRTTTYTKEISEEIDLSQNPNLMMEILEGFTKYDQDQIEKRYLGITASHQPVIEPADEWKIQEEDAIEYDRKADNWEYRKRKNKFILGEAPEDNRKGHKKIRRSKKLVVQSDSEDEELTFEEEEIILID